MWRAILMQEHVEVSLVPELYHAEVSLVPDLYHAEVSLVPEFGGYQVEASTLPDISFKPTFIIHLPHSRLNQTIYAYILACIGRKYD
jgi:hypothetical protein